MVRKSKNLLSSKIEDEAVILGIKSGNYFGFNQVGTEIWEYLENPITVDALVNVFISRYSGDTESIRADILDFLSSLLEKNLVEVVNEN